MNLTKIIKSITGIIPERPVPAIYQRGNRAEKDHEIEIIEIGPEWTNDNIRARGNASWIPMKSYAVIYARSPLTLTFMEGLCLRIRFTIIGIQVGDSAAPTGS